MFILDRNERGDVMLMLDIWLIEVSLVIPSSSKCEYDERDGRCNAGQIFAHSELKTTLVASAMGSRLFCETTHVQNEYRYLRRRTRNSSSHVRTCSIPPMPSPVFTCPQAHVCRIQEPTSIHCRRPCVIISPVVTRPH